ncbi:MAG TPA: helix-turn-helix domain-containing protein [Acidimicrobiales bacterium]
MRADALRNRRRLLDAACQAFVRLGPAAALEAIARDAGVGIATLYRHFPDRAALVRAVAADVMARTAAEARAALAAEDDAFAALGRYMHRALDLCAPALMPLLYEEVRGDPEVGALLDETATVQQELIDRARREGGLRPDVDFADIGPALGRFARPVGGAFDPALEAQLAHRHLQVFIDGLRATGGPTLPGPALSLTGLRSMMASHLDGEA